MRQAEIRMEGMDVMDSLHMDLIAGEASIQKAAFGNVGWNVFSRSIAWFKLRKNMNYIEREHFVKSWE